MKSTHVLMVGAFFTIGSLALCAEPDLTKLPPPANKPGLTYAKDIRGIFEASCFRCHGSERQKGGLRLDSLSAALKGGEDGQVIIAGKSDKSPLVIAVARLDEEKAMPPKPKGGPVGGGPGARPGPGGGSGATRNTRPPGAPGGSGSGSSAGGISRQGPGGPGGGFGPAPKILTPEQVGLIRAWIDQGAK